MSAANCIIIDNDSKTLTASPPFCMGVKPAPFYAIILPIELYHKITTNAIKN